MIQDRNINNLALNCGRNCLAYLIRARKIRRIALPDFICGTVIRVCRELQVAIRFYPVGMDLLPAAGEGPQADEYFYLVNYFGQLPQERTRGIPRLILDNVQAFYETPPTGVDTLCSCRKYFPVTDGAFLYSDAPAPDEPGPESVSGEMVLNDGSEDEFTGVPIRPMSEAARQQLQKTNFEELKTIRKENFSVLQEQLAPLNGLTLRVPEGPFMYPLYTEQAPELRKRLKKELYLPKLWPEVLRRCSPDSAAYRFARNILTLPVDSRYDPEDMQWLCEVIKKKWQKLPK